MLLTQPGPPLTLQPSNLLQFCNCLAPTIQLHCFLTLTSSPLLYKHMFYLSGWLVLTYMVLYEPNFSLMFSIHLFLYAGVYCTIIPKKGWINSNIKTLSLGGWASTKQIQTCTQIYSEQTCLLLCEDKNLHTKCSKCLASLFVR